MTDTTKGALAMAGAATIWGLSPLFYALLAHVPPLEVLAHRTIWSLAAFVVVLGLQRRLGELPRAIATPRRIALIAGAAAMISVNWFLFIFAVGAGRTVEASLGYYIFPLVAVGIGALVLREALTKGQKVAVALAMIAVGILTWGLGTAPWISLVLAVTFGIYGLIKRFVETGPVVSVTAEVLLFLPLSTGFLAWLWMTRGVDYSAGDIALFLLSGPLTAIPLMLFSYAARRTAMATVGLIQYLNPTLQFAAAALVLGEIITPWHMIAFPIIWAALAIYSVASFRRMREVPP